MSDAPQQRRLAAIVSIDIAGYSALVERDAPRALSHVTRLRERAENVATRHDGRIFNTAGDSVMLEFASASDALAAAIALWEAEQEAVLRFGVHVGEVMSAPNGDLLGHGVNVAARLQTEATPGGLLASQIVHDTAEPHLARRLTARGRIRLAKMRETIGVFALELSNAPAPQESATPVLAVLAFDPFPRHQ